MLLLVLVSYIWFLQKHVCPAQMKSSQLKLTQNTAQALPSSQKLTVTCDAHFTFTTAQPQQLFEFKFAF